VGRRFCTVSANDRIEFRVTAASPGKVNFELSIQKEHTNRLGILHGGTIASMVDLGGSLALASRGLFSTGVSTDLNVTYLNSGGKIGDLIRGEVVCDKCAKRGQSPFEVYTSRLTDRDKVGKTLAYTSIKFINKDNETIARGSHTKYVAIAQNDPQNIKHELKPEEPESKVV
jgi:acyl-coenzyme A thioesterase 13